MTDVAALGEILIDFTPVGMSGNGNIMFERNPGGAPANVAVCVSRLGGNAAFIGKVGNDMFGRFLSDILKENNIDNSGLRFSEAEKTTLAFVQLESSGERSFSFYRNPGADTTLRSDEIDYDIIKNAKVFHFGSLSLTDEPARSATISALKYARANGCIISYDPNLRPPLWKNLNEAKKQIESVMDFADILKISEEEMEFLTGENSLEKGTEMIYSKYGTALILVTMGAEGSFVRLKDITCKYRTFKDISAVDTTGAGDSFLGGFLYSILNMGHTKCETIEKHDLDKAVRFANATASLCVTKKGAIPAMPDLESVRQLLD